MSYDDDDQEIAKTYKNIFLEQINIKNRKRK